MSSLDSNGASLPDLPDETSRGSSVSSDFQREYEEILKFAVVTPKFEIASNVYDQATKRPKQVKVTNVNTDSRPISGADALHLTTIDEDNETTLSNEASTEEDNSSRSWHKVSQSAQQESIILSSQRKAPKDALLNGTNIHFHSMINNNGDFSNGARALDMLIAGNDVKRLSAFGFNSSASETTSSSVNQSPSGISMDEMDGPLDQDLVRMEGLMDEWCLELKRNVLGEFSASKLKLIEKLKQKVYMQKQKHAADLNMLQNETEGLKELVHAFEKSVHQKDVVITNLTDAVQKQREKCEKLKILLTWKLKHNDEKREQFASKLARKHYERSLASKTWAGWRSIVESRWKQRVERACQARSQEVCIKLTEDYEERLLGLQRSLDSARAEVARLHNERDQYEETMKKAFMRGVCALNMEAMYMFKENSNDENVDPATRGTPLETIEGQTSSTSTHASHQKQSNVRSDQHAETAARKSTLPNAKFPGDRKIHVKAVGKADYAGRKMGNGSGQPMVTSVFVERHKQDDERSHQSSKGANQFKNQQSRNQISRGAASGTNQRTNRVQTVKVVE